MIITDHRINKRDLSQILMDYNMYRKNVFRVVFPLTGCIDKESQAQPLFPRCVQNVENSHQHP